jgi:hypothetical protein
LQQIGTPRAGDELAALKCALKGRDVLAFLSAWLPLQIGNLSSDQLDECKALIDSAAARDGELFLYALLTVMNRMTAPWQLIRLGVKAAGSDTAARVAETNYGAAVNIVLAELERMVAELRVGICRYFAGELAINEMTQRALTELRQYLDNGTQFTA